MTQQVVRKKKKRIRARFFSVILTVLITIFIISFFFRSNQSQLPNLRGWESVDVLRFAQEFEIDVSVVFVYTHEIAPTKVVSQSLAPGTPITEIIELIIEVSKGIEVR